MIATATLPLPTVPATASDATASQGMVAVGTGTMTPAEQAAFAGVLALLIEPKAAGVPTAAVQPAASDDSGDAGQSTEDSSDEPKTDAHKTLDPASDLTGIARTLNASMIVRDLGALQPVFRAKLETVIQRMSEEYGHTVSVTETYRNQARQDQLLQQGRTKSGPIVTWTSHSLHTRGRAADLLIDGSWNNPVGFQHLQQIASEEGLSTLGPRDPGHVELREDPLGTITSMAQITGIGVQGTPVATHQTSVNTPFILSGARVAAQAPQAVAAFQVDEVDQPAQAAPVGSEVQVAQVAQLAQVARVAVVAPVAQVAQVAPTAPVAALVHSERASAPAVRAAITPPASAAAPAVPAAPAPASHHSSAPTIETPARGASYKGEATPAASSASGGGSSTDPGSDRRRRDPSSTAAPAAESVAPARTTAAPPLAAASQISGAETSSTIETGTTAPVADTGTAARAAALIALQEAKDALPVSHMLLQLDNPDGGLDRIRVGVRGAMVGATIDTHDPVAATDMARNVQQLASALQARGLDADSLRVRVAGGASMASPGDLARAVAASGDRSAPPLGTLFAQAGSPSSRTRGEAQGQRSQQDPSRQRARKDQQGAQQ